jgi:hypothetical protein
MWYETQITLEVVANRKQGLHRIAQLSSSDGPCQVLVLLVPLPDLILSLVSPHRLGKDLL